MKFAILPISPHFWPLSNFKLKSFNLRFKIWLSNSRLSNRGFYSASEGILVSNFHVPNINFWWSLISKNVIFKSCTPIVGLLRLGCIYDKFNWISSTSFSLFYDKDNFWLFHIPFNCLQKWGKIHATTYQD